MSRQETQIESELRRITTKTYTDDDVQRQDSKRTWRQYYVVHDIFKDKRMDINLCDKCTTTQLPTR